MLGYEKLTEIEREASLQAVKARLEKQGQIKNKIGDLIGENEFYTNVGRRGRFNAEDFLKYTILTDLQTTAALRSGQTECVDRCPICIDNYPSVIEPAYELEGITRYNQNDGTLCKECWGTLWIDSDRLKLVNGKLELKE